MKNKHISITQKNVLIDEIATIIQEARLIVCESDEGANAEQDNIIRCLCLVVYVLGEECERCTFEDAIQYDEFKEIICVDDFSTPRNKKAYNKLCGIISVSCWEELLIYAFEAFEYLPSLFLNSKKKKGVHVVNGKRKSGIYYTPNDVVEFMVDKCSSEVSWYERRIIDCSCGTGAFLEAILKRIVNELKKPEDILNTISNCIWGVDLSENAVISCRYILLMKLMSLCRGKQISFKQAFDIFTHNIVCGDSLDLPNVLTSNAFPNRFSCVIGNPPYVNDKKYGNVFIKFVHNLIDFGDSNSNNALVVPLSICTGKAKAYVGLRQRIESDKAEWEFINFDRSPDSLFGDHVKTRNTIVVRNSKKDIKNYEAQTSGLIRWSYDSREKLFNDIQQVNIGGTSIATGIPKVSLREGWDFCKLIFQNKQSLGNELLGCSESPFYINATAYNWISVFDHIPDSRDEKDNLYVPESLMTFYAGSEDEKYYYIAMLSNRITYWLWSVFGDGFHVEKNFVLGLPYAIENFDEQFCDRMVDFGRLYASEISKYPRYSYNCGKKILNYDHTKCFGVINRIEDEIIMTAGENLLRRETIAKWYDNQVTCGRK